MAREPLTIQALAQEALYVQNACNLSGVARGLVRAIDDLRVRLPGASTDELNQHPITQAWVSKLASLAGVTSNQAKLWTTVSNLAEGKTP